MLKGHHAIITGGSSGIGLEIAKAFVENGASVWLIARDEEKLKRAKDQLAEKGEDVRLTSADLSNHKGVSRVVEKVTSEWSALNTLVNNAAIGRFKSFETVEEEDLDRHFSLNVYVPYRLTQGLLPLLSESKGSVINISSYLAERMVPLLPTSVYSATKGALNSLTKSLARELGSRKVRVNAISPGTVRTPQFEHNIGQVPEDKREAFFNYVNQNYALERIGEPSEVGGLAVLLASQKAQWITGGIFNVDGGLTVT